MGFFYQPANAGGQRRLDSDLRSERGGGRLYEQCRPNIDLVPDFVPADYFSKPGVWERTETIVRAPGTGLVSLRLGGWGRLQVDAVELVELAK